MQRVCCVSILLVLIFLGLTEASTNGRKSQIRYLNSMPQFGKAKFTVSSPQAIIFDQVPQGYLTDYNKIDAQTWNFNSIFITNVTAKSDLIDLDGDSYATVFTCQSDARKLKNKMVYDTARSTGPKTALLRTINLMQFDYPINVYNGSKTLFSNVPYCSASPYISVVPGEYDFDWAAVDSKRQPRVGNATVPGVRGGQAYTLFTTPLGAILVVDAKKKSTRSVSSGIEEGVSSVAEVVPVSEQVNEVKKMKTVKEEKEVKNIQSQLKRNRRSNRQKINT